MMGMGKYMVMLSEKIMLPSATSSPWNSVRIRKVMLLYSLLMMAFSVFFLL
ncbi:MAG: hypothetical protein J7L31_04770 [Thermoplasmata archaeon]|nr:hypothetical protein [Thermoplasmata archaeon]